MVQQFVSSFELPEQLWDKVPFIAFDVQDECQLKQHTKLSSQPLPNQRQQHNCHQF